MSNNQDIEIIQKEYKDNFFKLYEIYFKNEITYDLASRFIDEINSFWHKNKELMSYEIERLTENNTCILLSGAIYLDIKEYEHFYFKTFGDYHFLPDPFLKLEPFFFIPKEEIDMNETLGYFSRVLQDTYDILKNHYQHFFFIPMRLMAIDNIDQHQSLIDSFFIRFISKLFNQEFNSKEDFICHDWNYQEIERKISKHAPKIIFSEIDESDLTIQEKIENYIRTQMNVRVLTSEKSEAEIFWICLYTWLSQVFDILLICTYLRLQPYIRFSITFHYLSWLMYTFIEDEYMKNIIQQSIIFFVFRKSYNITELTKIDFDSYVYNVRQVNLMEEIVKEMEKEKLNIFEGGIKNLERIIDVKIKEYIMNT